MNNAKAMMQPFTEEIPTYEEGRTLLDGRRLDKNGNIVEMSQEEKEANGMTSNSGLLIDTNEIQEEKKQGMESQISPSAQLMNQVKGGIAAMFGAVKSGAAYAH